MSKKRNLLSSYFVILVLCISLLTGCNRLDTAKDAINYMKNKSVNAELVSTEKAKDKKSVVYTLRDQDKGFEFHYRTYYTTLSIDGASSSSWPSRTDDYKECLNNYLEPKIKDIENKYGVVFVGKDASGIVNQMSVSGENEALIDKESANAALNELMELYNFDDEPLGEITVSLMKGDTTRWYFPYTAHGAKGQLQHVLDDFYAGIGVDKELHEKVYEYVVNHIGPYSYISVCSLEENDDRKVINYHIKGKEVSGRYQELKLNLTKYLEDSSKGEIALIDDYILP